MKEEKQRIDSLDFVIEHIKDKKKESEILSVVGILIFVFLILGLAAANFAMTYELQEEIRLISKDMHTNMHTISPSIKKEIRKESDISCDEDEG